MMFITSASRRYLWCSMVDGRLLTVSLIGGFSKSSSTLLRILNFFLLESSMICSTWRGLWSFPIIFSTWRLGTATLIGTNIRREGCHCLLCNDHLWVILFYQMSSPYNLSSMWLVSIVLLNQLNWIVLTFPHPEMCVFFPIRLSTPV